MKIFDSSYLTRNLEPLEEKAGTNVLGHCLSAKKGEKILIVTDEAKLEMEAPIFFESAKFYSDQITMAVIPPSEHHGQEPSQQLTELMEKQDIVLLVTSYSLSHTAARHKACDAGARIASLPSITHEVILRTLIIDYHEISALTKKVAGYLTMAQTARLTSPAGTDIRLSLAGRDAISDSGLIHNPRDFGNLPAGEGFIAPEEGTSDGVVIFDGGFIETLIDEPIKVTIEKGSVVKIEGGMGARQLEITLNSIGPDARNIAELGVGTNKACKLESSILEIEKVYGTSHLALGNNLHFGGEVDVQYHADGVILKPTLTLDDKIILKDGEFQI